MYKITFSLIILFSISAFAGPTKIYVPRESGGQIITQPVETQQKPEALKSMVSHKNILDLERDKPYSLPKSKDGLPVTAATQADTLKVLVLKVEFQTEDPDDPTTTGNGNFDLRTLDQFRTEEGHEFDPAPHNSAYFDAHMQALNRYWWYVSDFQIRLNWDIYPQGENDAYRLPNRMAYYGSEGPWTNVIERLLHFVHDAITLADTTSPEINFSQYQSIIIFHAGADQQNNFAFIEDTPNDFWTGFLWTDDSVSVDSGSCYISEVVIMPETASQDNRVTVLNGVMAHEFGHQLGLVDIYNTSNFLTQVGNFSLMDNNGSNFALELDEQGTLVSGALPSYPDAWSRAYLGFSGVREVTNDSDIVITAAEQNYRPTEVIKVPISEMEYFLIENRQREADFEYIHYPDPILNAILADSATGVIMGPGWAFYGFDQLNKRASGEYDRLLPGDGILIWHVDEVVAYLDYLGSGSNNFLNNTLQWDYNRRFLSLVEADGIIDFGGNYYTGFGDAEDYFNSRNRRNFTPSTNPSTRSNLGADTHISITDIYADPADINRDTIMTCDIDVDWYQAGFPSFGWPEVGADGGGLLAFDMDSDGRKEILAGRGRFLIAVNYDGSPFTDNMKSAMLFSKFDSEIDTLFFPMFAALDEYINGQIVAGDFDDDDSLEIACFDAEDKLYLFDCKDVFPVDSLADLLDSRVFSSALTAGLIAYDIDADGRDELIAGLADSSLVSISYTESGDFVLDTLKTFSGIPDKIAIAIDTIFVIYGENNANNLYVGDITNGSSTEIADISLPAGDAIGLVCGDIDRDGACDAVMTVGDYLCIYNGETQAVKKIHVDDPGQPALGDIDADGYPDIVVSAGTNYLKTYAFNHAGILLDHFPVTLSKKDPEKRSNNQPILTDIDGDNRPDIVIALPNGALSWGFDFDGDHSDDTTFSLTTGGLTCINYQGYVLGGFPLSTSSEVGIEPVIADLDGDGDIEIAALDSIGYIAAWDLGATPDSLNMPWPMAGGGISRQGYLSPEFQKEFIIADGFLPGGSVYNYPNPASNETVFRYYVDRPADINIKIFDMSGELVEELAGSTQGEIDDEVPWDCSRFASGVYFARFEANSVNANKNVLIKVALIK
jgi:M6 family metalloprotease-like protein